MMSAKPWQAGSSMASSSENGYFLYNLLLFGRLLRRLGLDVHTGRMLDALGVLEYIGVKRKRDFRDALRTLLVHRQEDLSLFDEAFQVFWRPPKNEWTTMDLRSLGEQRRYRQPQVGPPPPGSDSQGQGSGDAETGQDVDRVDLTQTYSSREVLRVKDFARYTTEELVQAQGMMAELNWQLGRRHTRRWVRGEGPALDLRRVLRHNVRYGGELLDLPRRRRKEKPRPLVLICDVSGSMERYTRMLLHFIHSLATGPDQLEAFLFATRLTRITGHLAHRGVDEAISEVSRAVPDWAGGTRIGEVLKVFNFRWARRVLGWGTVVLVISDGWDRGEPEMLRHEIARLQRSCHRLIWLNPLLGSPTYQPLTQGMQAVLPFVDDLLPVNNLASLDDLARHLSTLSPQRAARRQQVQMALSMPATEDVEAPTAIQRSGHPDANPTFRHPLWGGSPSRPHVPDTPEAPDSR